MKIDYASDLHFNHWMLWTPNQEKWEKRSRSLTNFLIRNGHGEVLVLAGDFSEWNNQTVWILDEASKHYERVYFTYGNHDLYLISKSQRKKYGDSLGRLDELLEKMAYLDNVIPLIKSTDTYKGVTFAGDVMWYLPKGVKDWSFFNNNSNDSAYINMSGYSTEDMVRKMWWDSMKWYDTLEHEEIDIFVSHVPPLHNPFTYHEPNSCYTTEVPFFSSKHWICGHDHQQGSFDKRGIDTKFHMNSLGYPQEYSNYKAGSNELPSWDIDQFKEFKVRTFEI
ncbi:metallophosphoesterase [Alkalihalobacillus sp. NPDC078783]